MIEHSSDIGELAKALHAAQGALGGVVRDAKNPHFKSSYASLESVVAVAKPALQAAGLAFTQAPGALVDGALEVTTMLMHAGSGQWMRSTVHVPLAKRDPQGVGSAITYACRYTLMAALGLPPVDDDGESAMLRGEPPHIVPQEDDRPAKRDAARDKEIETALDQAAQRGKAVLKACWDSLAAHDKAHFKGALDRRFKPMAEAADRGLATGEAA